MSSTFLPVRRRGRLAVALALLVLGSSACGLAGDDSSTAAGTTTSAASPTPGTTPSTASSTVGSTATSAADAPWPRTVQDCGQEVTIPSRPTNVVGLEGGAETLMALDAGAQGQMSAWFGAKPADLSDTLRAGAGSAKFLGGSFPSPTLEDVLAGEPDLVVLYGYIDDAGLTKRAFDDLGVPTLVLSESCAKDADPTVAGYFDDVRMIAHAIGADDRADGLLATWQQQIDAATATPVTGTPMVYVNGNTDPKSPFASGGGSLANDQIDIAGGTNAFGDSKQAFLEPSWEEIATRDPDVIVDGSGGLEESTQALREYLGKDPALSQMTAVKNDAFVTLGYYDNVPGPRMVDGIVKLAEFLRR